LAGRPPTKAAADFLARVATSKMRFEEVLLMSEYPYGANPVRPETKTNSHTPKLHILTIHLIFCRQSYIYTWKSFLIALEKMTQDEIGPGKFLCISMIGQNFTAVLLINFVKPV
jgi:hypothetical protein